MTTGAVAPAPGRAGADPRCAQARQRPGDFPADVVGACNAAERTGLTNERLERLERSNQRAINSICPTSRC